MEKGSVEERVLASVCDRLWLDNDEIEKKLKTIDLNIVGNLGADDENIVHLIHDFEEEFGIKIRPDEFGIAPHAGRACRKFSQIVELIKSKL